MERILVGVLLIASLSAYANPTLQDLLKQKNELAHQKKILHEQLSQATTELARETTLADSCNANLSVQQMYIEAWNLNILKYTKRINLLSSQEKQLLRDMNRLEKENMQKSQETKRKSFITQTLVRIKNSSKKISAFELFKGSEEKRKTAT